MALVREPGAFFRAAGDADDAAALDLRDLPRDGARRPGRAADEHGVAALRAPDLEHPEIRRETRQRQREHERGVEVRRQLRRRHEAGPRRFEHEILLPAAQRIDDVTALEFRMARLDDLRDAAGTHDVAELDDRHVRLHRHPRALRRIERQVQRLREHLTVRERRHIRLDEPEQIRGHEAFRPPLEQPLSVRSHRHAFG